MSAPIVRVCAVYYMSMPDQWFDLVGRIENSFEKTSDRQCELEMGTRNTKPSCFEYIDTNTKKVETRNKHEKLENLYVLYS